MILPTYTACIENLYKCAPTSELKTFTHKYTHTSVCTNTHVHTHTQTGQMPKMDIRNTQTHGDFINITLYRPFYKRQTICVPLFIYIFITF